MAVEIRELIIRVVAGTNTDQMPQNGSQPTSDMTPDQEAIIQECVKQVLRILKKQKER